jgi:hypothetical protein
MLFRLSNSWVELMLDTFLYQVRFNYKSRRDELLKSSSLLLLYNLFGNSQTV